MLARLRGVGAVSFTAGRHVSPGAAGEAAFLAVLPPERPKQRATGLLGGLEFQLVCGAAHATGASVRACWESRGCSCSKIGVCLGDFKVE